MAPPRAKTPATVDEAGTPIGEYPEGHQALRPRLTVTCSSCSNDHEIAQPDDEEMKSLVRWECHSQLGMVDSPDGGEIPLLCGKKNIVPGSGTEEASPNMVSQHDDHSVYLHERDAASTSEGSGV